MHARARIDPADLRHSDDSYGLQLRVTTCCPTTTEPRDSAGASAPRAGAPRRPRQPPTRRRRPQAIPPGQPEHRVHRAAGLGESSCCRQEPSRGYLRARTGAHRPGRPPAQRRQLRAPTAGDCAARPPQSRGTQREPLPLHGQERLLDPTDLPHGDGGYGLEPALPDHHRAAGPGEPSAPQAGATRRPDRPPTRRPHKPRSLPHGQEREPAGRRDSDSPGSAECPSQESLSIYDMCWAAGGASLHSPGWIAFR